MQLHEKATHFNLVLLNPLAGLEMDPGTALDETFKLFNLKAKTIAASSGVSEQQLSKFRNGHQDMHARGLFRVVSALPRSARFHFYSLIEPDIEEASPPPRPALAPAVPIARELPGIFHLRTTRASPPYKITFYTSVRRIPFFHRRPEPLHRRHYTRSHFKWPQHSFQIFLPQNREISKTPKPLSNKRCADPPRDRLEPKTNSVIPFQVAAH